MNGTFPRSDVFTLIPHFRAIESDGQFLYLYLSALLRTDDALSEPIRNHLSSYCFTATVVDRRIPDSEMMTGFARFIVIEIHETCPEQPHSCKFIRTDALDGIGMS